MIEVLITLGVVALLVLVVLPQVLRPHVRSPRIHCLSNLKQVGLGFLLWANDNSDQFPWQTSTNRGGSQELVGRGNAFVHFLTVSNGIVSPKVLVCPAEKARMRLALWAKFSDANLSYCAGLDAHEAAQDSILSSDRNLTGGVQVANELFNFSSNNAGWGTTHHVQNGNLGLADGSAMQSSTAMLLKQLAKDQEQRQTNVTHLAIPLPLLP